MQVILWLERNDSRIQLSSRVERRDVNTLINSSENEAMFRQISRVVVKADLLRYEVSLLKYSEFPTIRLAENKDAIKFASVYVELSEDQQKHRKNCETALFKVRIVENVFCRKERKEGRKERKKEIRK